MVRDVFIYLCAILLVVTSLVHSILGEEKLIKPLMEQTEGILRHKLARFLLRFAWHVTSLAWTNLAAILIVLVIAPENALKLSLLITGTNFLIVGVFDAFASRGKHIGAWMLGAIGICGLVAYFCCG
ncbi:MAG TPA: hypothetical protein V6C97_34865 [Oculatellaceae cyanobacterium]